MNQNNILITGIPRSGTTLTCHLLNKLPNTVALAEPLYPKKLMLHRSTENFSTMIEQFFVNSRQSLLANGRANTRNFSGHVPDNTVSNEFGGVGRFLPSFLQIQFDLWPFVRLIANKIPVQRIRKRFKISVGLRPLRQVQHHKGLVHFPQPLTDSFLLCVKHNELFTFALDTLITHFRCYAIIRNPLAVLASWNSVSFPLQHGWTHALDILQHPLADELMKINNKYDRQICILDALTRQYQLFLTADQIIRYEDIIASNGKALQKITMAATQLNDPLQSKNNNPLYDKKLMAALSQRLLDSDGAFWHFYSREDVIKLEANLTC